MVAAARRRAVAIQGARWNATAAWRRPLAALAAAAAVEWEERRVFLWLPAAAGAGVLLYFAADQEPVLWLPLLLAAVTAGCAILLRQSPVAFCLACGCGALCLGFVAAEVRSRMIATPMLERIRIVKLTGVIEAVDKRPQGARFLLSIEDAGGFDPAHAPRLVRLTTRRDDPLAAGDVVAVTARLLPPARAALPGGYDFARDAYFSGIGAVGTALGRVRPAEPRHGAGPWREAFLAIDRARNALAARVSLCVGGGDAGAVAAAMVTGKGPPVGGRARDHPRGRDLPHHHHRGRPDDAGGGPVVRRHPQAPGPEPAPVVASPHQEMGRRRRHPGGRGL